MYKHVCVQNRYDCLSSLGVLFVGVLVTRAPPFSVHMYISALEFLETPRQIYVRKGLKNTKELPAYAILRYTTLKVHDALFYVRNVRP